MSTNHPDRSYAASSTDTPKPVTIKSGLTRRALVIGGVLAVLLNIWAIHSAYSAGSSHISSTHLPVAALFPFLVVGMLLNPVPAGERTEHDPADFVIEHEEIWWK